MPRRPRTAVEAALDYAFREPGWGFSSLERAARHVARVQRRAPSASPTACLRAYRRVRRLAREAERLTNDYRDGRLGRPSSPRTWRALRDALQAAAPGFTAEQYESAITRALLWTR